MNFSRWRMPFLLLGTIAAAFSFVGLFVSRAEFFHAYLFAWLFWSGLSFGALVILMMQFLTGGMWGLALRPFALAAIGTVPLMALLFLPVLHGLGDIYSWTHGFEGSAYHHRAQWLTVPFFTVRSLFYLGLLSLLAVFLRRLAFAQNDPREVSTRLTVLSAGGLIAYVLCMNFASTDWAMSLDPEWFSTIFVVIFMAGHFLGALALLTGMLALAARDRSLGDRIPLKVFNDLGSLLLAFVIFWIYVTFSQFLIIWSGNLPREIGWYLDRSRGGWKTFAVLLMAAEFLLPFFLLLSRAAKRNRQRLLFICALILSANVLHSFWLVAPTFTPAGFRVHWLDLTLFLALGGFWAAAFLHFLRHGPLVARELLEETPDA